MERAPTRLRDVAGRDAPLPRWLLAPEPAPERPRFDSVVICGNGIGASVMAARLARSAAFAGKVVVAAPPVLEDRRLVGGLTLRSRALDYYAAAFGRARSELLDLLFAGRADDAATTHQMGSIFVPDAPGRLRAVNPQQWMSGSDHGGRVLAYGVRNSHLAARLWDAARELPIAFHRESIDSVDAARALAPGSKPLIVNATMKPLGKRGAAASSPAPGAFVAAAQMPFSAPRVRERGVLDDGASLFACVPRDGRNDMGVFNPLVDPLSAAASYYGIVFRVLRPESASRKESEQAALHEELVRIADAVGLEPVDPAETEGRALVPCLGWKDLRRLDEDVLELNRLYHAGNPIITGDGMAKAGLAALVCAEAVLAGEDPVPIANRALKRWRRANAALALGMTRFSRVAAAAIRRSPRMLAAGANQPDFWAGIDRKN